MRADITRIVETCARFWRETGVPRRRVEEMRSQLDLHLSEAVAEGHSIEDVIGPDLAGFAEAWASSYRRQGPSWEEVMSGATALARARRRELIAYGTGTVALMVAVAVAGKGEETVDVEIWRWLWTGFAVVMGIGEIFTSGFFLLPFAIGAAAAAVLAWLGVGVMAQWLVFFGVSVISLAYLRRYINRQDTGEQPRVGANRWIGSDGVVLEEINPDTAGGMVRIDNEEWRAASRHGVIIPAGARIVVRDVRGSRLVVEQIES
jgi:membrane protein implicated in regulation of membrane protease activity